MADTDDHLTPWGPGQMDIHHINTGRGSCTYCVLPDGTTLLIDAGEMEVEPPVDGIQRRTDVVPDDSRLPWEWIVRYIETVTRHRDPEFDYVWLTHFHSDHLGYVKESSPTSDHGVYRLTGLTGVCDRIPFHKLIDRGWPDNGYPLSAAETRLADRSSAREGFANSQATEDNYIAFLEWHRSERDVVVERFDPGRRDQIALKRNADAYPEVYFQNVYCNGVVWTGKGQETRQVIPDVATLGDSLPNENTCSCAGVLHSGPFRYFAGGDITGIVEMGKPDWFDIESPVADAIGRVDVAVLNHHGHRDTHNEHFVSTVRPRVWIGHSWSADHPGQGVFSRLISRFLYDEDRDMFATNMMDANRAVIGPRLDQGYRSTQGHIVVRVEPGGERYSVMILDESTMSVKDRYEYNTSSHFD